MNQGGAHFFSSISRAPMLRMTLPFVAGIVLSIWWPVPLTGALVVLLICTVLLVIALFRNSAFERRWVRGASVQLWFLVFGMCYQVVRDPLALPTHLAVDGAEAHERVVRITAVNGISEKVVRADGRVLAVRSSDEVLERTGSVMLTLMRQPGHADPIAGDELVVRSRVASITRIPDPGGFDRRSWAASRGMYHETFAGPDEWSIVGHAWRWTDLFEPTRQRVAAWLAESGLPFRERALVKALVLGLRDELDHEQKDSFVKSGTIHVLAVSGTHVGFIYAMLLFMFGWWGGGGRARIIRGVVILLALWGYAGLTGACPSVLRATFMFSLFTLAGMSARRADPLNSLFAAAMVLLLWDPHMIIEIGFQLSFLAVLGIILFYGPLQRLWIPDTWLVGQLWSLTVMSLAAQTLTTPLSLYLFQAFPVWFLPANLIVVTAAGIAVYGAVALLVLYRVPYLGPLLVFLLTLLLTIVDRVTAFFADLPFAYPAIRASFTDMMLLYAITALIAIRLMWHWRPALRLSLAAGVLVLASWGYRAHTAQDRVAFTVYDDRRMLQAGMVTGRDLTMLVPEGDSALSPWLVQKAERHARALGLHRTHVIEQVGSDGPPTLITAGQTMFGSGRWIARGMDVYFHSGVDEVPVGLRTDVLVLHALRYLDENDLERLGSGAGHIVLAGGLPWKVRSFVQRWCGARNIPCHDVREHGAFILEGRAA